MPLDGTGIHKQSRSVLAPWHFPRSTPDSVPSSPHFEAFFNSQLDKVQALVREAGQNSLDNKLPGMDGPVHIRVSLRRIDRETLEQLSEADLDHWGLCGIDKERILADPNNWRILTVEDFNTTGLTGPLHAFDMNQPGAFAAFFRLNGETTKKNAGKGGTFGIGKATYAHASMLRAFIGHTVRNEPEDDPREGFVMGQSVLKVHQDDPSKPQIQAIGTFCGGTTGEGYTDPFRGDEAIAISQKIGFSREPGETGLSVAVLCPDEGFSEDTLVNAFLEHFFYQIAENHLEVVVATENENDGGLEERVLSADTIFREIDCQLAESEVPLEDGYGIRVLVGMLRSRHLMESVEIDAPKSGGITRECFSEEDIQKLDKLWEDDGTPFRVSARFAIAPASGSLAKPVSHGRLSIIMRGAAENEEPIQRHVRSSVTLCGMGRSSPAPKRFYALVVAEGDENEEIDASQFFAKTEGPAHTTWVQRRGPEHFTNGCVQRAFRVACHGAKDIEQALSENQEDTKVSSFFDNLLRGLGSGGEAMDDTPEAGVCRDMKTASFEGNGVCVYYAPRELPAEWRGQKVGVKFGYQKPGTDKLEWDRSLFQFDETAKNRIAPTVDSGGELLSAKGNVAEVRVDDEGFQMTATGFDADCTIRVDMWPIYETEEGA